MPLGEKVEIQGKVSGAIDIGKVPLGSRSNVTVDWTVRGKDISASMRTTDYLLTRADGVSIINSLGVMTTNDNEKISVKLGGYGLVPALSKMGLKGFITYETASSKYSAFNSRVDVFVGEFLPEKGELTLSCYEWKES